jgi:hypothetical protein
MRILVMSLMLLVPATAVAGPIQLSLLRTIQMGTSEQLQVAEIIQYAKSDEASYLDHVLARSALLVLDKDEGFPDWPVSKLLDRTLNQLQRRSHAYHLPPEIPAGFGGEDVVFTVVYALVVKGKTEEAIDVLGRHLDSGSRYKRGVVLQALRNIGNQRANSLIQQVANTRDDRNLAENLLADHHYPFLDELHRHLRLIPSHQRGREELFAIAGERCSRRATLAVYFMGFLAPSVDWKQNEAELDLLRDLTRAPCFYTRYFAIRALALRSAESIDFWTELFNGEEDAWQRAQIARIGFARFGKTFATPALALLRGEPVQYVQWELMHGNIEVREGAQFRDYRRGAGEWMSRISRSSCSGLKQGLVLVILGCAITCCTGWRGISRESKRSATCGFSTCSRTRPATGGYSRISRMPGRCRCSDTGTRWSRRNSNKISF